MLHYRPLMSFLEIDWNDRFPNANLYIVTKCESKYFCLILSFAILLVLTYYFQTLFSDEFCDGYPHNMLPTPGYWVECSRAISNQGSAWTNDERDLHEIDEGITDSPDESIRDASVITDLGSSESSMPR